MKAAVYYETGEPDVFRYEDVPDPTCAPNGVVIEVEAVSIEGGDVLARAGGMLSAKPHIVGYQCAGVIREVGADVSGLEVGQRAVAINLDGSHAELRAAPALSTWAIPDGVETEAAACVPIPVGTADDCLFEFGRLQAGETVLAHAGGGGVGMAAIQLAKRAGATVLATAGTDEKLSRLKEFGLDHGINYREVDFVEAVRDITGGRGVDVVVDSLGGQILEKSIEAAAYRGRISSVGGAARDEYRPDVTLLRPTNKSLTGVFFGAELFNNHDRVHPMVAKHIADVGSGALQVVVDRRFPLSEAAEAHRYIESRQAFGRVLLIP